MSHEHGAARLAERVYKWAIDGLDYRPGTSNAPATSPFVTELSSQGHKTAEAGLQPQDLYPLCYGPLGSIFEHLVDNIRPRSEAQDSQDRILHERLAARRQRKQEARVKRQAVDQKRKECQDLAREISTKYQKIEQCKERIKRSKQISMSMQQCHDQARESTAVLQEYYRALKSLERGIGGKQQQQQHGFQQDSRRSLAQLKSDTDGLCRQLTMVAREMVTKKMPTTDERQQMLTNQAFVLHDRIKSIPGGGLSFLEIVISLQNQLLQDLDMHDSLSSGSSKSAEILKIFRAHHRERLEQVDMVLRQIAVQEQAKEDTIEQMQNAIQTLERSGSDNLAIIRRGNVHLELEIVKAQVVGLSAALEFVQAEQEVLIERTPSAEEQSKRLEAIGRGSRTAQQRTVQAQRTLQDLAQLLISKHETMGSRLARSQQHLEETAPLLTKLHQLAQERMRSVEQGCITTIRRLESQQQNKNASCSRAAATTPRLLSQSNNLDFSDLHQVVVGAERPMTYGAPHLSLDRLTIDSVALQSEVRLQASLVEQLSETQSKMTSAADQISARWRQGIETSKNAVLHAYPEYKSDLDNPVGGNDQFNIHIEAEAMQAIHLAEHYDNIHQQAAIQHVQQSLDQCDAAITTVKQIESLAQESQTLQECPWVEKTDRELSGLQWKDEDPRATLGALGVQSLFEHIVSNKQHQLDAP